jgi:hypothetical protein
MNFAHVSLSQNGGVVTGQYHDWGYTYLDATNAGTISGSAAGNIFTGTFQDNAADAGVSLSWTLSPGQLQGSYGPSAYPWCGVPAGQGTPLPAGCGWSDAFIGKSSYPTLQQVADEVTGSYVDPGAPTTTLGTMAGVVSDLRLNGRFFNTYHLAPGRFSFQMTADGTQFTGNFYVGSHFDAWCGERSGTLPTTCLGGGGIYDGTWFTNLGTITLAQPQVASSPATGAVTGVWFPWGSDTEYTIQGVANGPSDDAGPSTDFSLSWTDNSPLGGTMGMTSLSSDPNGLTLQGQAVEGGLWCGVSYGTNPFVPSPLPDAGQIGTLYTGCGLTNDWNLSGDPSAPPTTAQLVQTRGTVTGFTDTQFDFDSVTGSTAFNPLSGTGIGSWTMVTGSWADSSTSGGSFTWYPDSQDLTFVGEFDAGGPNSGGWCGSLSGAGPSPCAPPVGNFAGEWDMSFAHVSLTQDGGFVSGRYRDWGYTYSDPKNAGQISGTVEANIFQGTFQDNNPGDPAVPLTWTLSPGQLNGTYQYGGSPPPPPYPWCGVVAGQGTPLPTGCGWSDTFYPGNQKSMTLQQTADQVTGTYGTDVISGGVVTGGDVVLNGGLVTTSRVNGQYANPGPAHFSFWMTPDGTQFSGNYVYVQNKPWCGCRGNPQCALPGTCLGGGGYYDGTWFTNLGTVTLTQPQPNISAVSGVWFFWGSETEYTIDGVATGPAVGSGTGASTLYSLSWTDDSPLGGAVGMTSLPANTNGVTLQGQAVQGGGLWCGVTYGPSPVAADAGVLGTLYPGCGLSNGWTFSGSPDSPEITGELVQTRGSVTGSAGASGVLGTVGLNTTGVGSWTVVTGTWTDSSTGGDFTWYPDSQDLTFSGDFDGGAWCGSVSGTLPSSCLQ